jgi:hypothetical protein
MWVNDEQRVQAIVAVLSDDYSRKIIASTVSEAKSPEQISEQNAIPVSTCYRRIHDLVALSMIQVSKIDLSSGKKSVLYKSVYRDISVKFESEKLAVDLVLNGPEIRSNQWIINQCDANDEKAETSIVIQDCDLCQSNNAVCKVFVTGDSKSYLSVCSDCEKRMHERNTIKAVETMARERMSQTVLNVAKRK